MDGDSLLLIGAWCEVGVACEEQEQDAISRKSLSFNLLRTLPVKVVRVEAPVEVPLVLVRGP